MASGGKTVGIWEDAKAFRRRVRLPAAQVAALAPGELEAALAYEVEPFSGVAASAAEVAWREVESVDRNAKTYDVAVRARGGGKSAGADAAGAKFLKPLAIAGALLLAAAATDAALLAFRISSLESEVAERSALDGEVKAIRRMAGSARARARETREAREAEAAAQKRADSSRSAYPEIMSAIASVCGGKVIVKSFSAPEAFEMEISAAAPDAPSAAAAMSRLTQEAAKAGWKLRTGPIDSAAGAAANFSFVLAREDRE